MKNFELDNSVSKLSCSWLGDGLQDVMGRVFFTACYQAAARFLGLQKRPFPWSSPLYMIVHRLHGSIKNMLILQSASLLGATFHSVEKAKMTGQITMKIN